MERYCFSPVCTFKKVIKNLKLKVDVRKGPIRFRGKSTIDVLVSSGLPYFIPMMCVLGSYYNELYLMDDNCSTTLLLESESGLYM